MLIDITTHIYPKTASVFSPSLAFAAVIMLLLPNLSDLLASNNLDNTSQKKFEFRKIINLTNQSRDPLQTRACIFLNIGVDKDLIT